MTKNKPVGLSYFNKKHKELNQKEKYYFDIENDEYIEYYPKFDNKKIDELLRDLVSSVRGFNEEGIEFLRNDLEIEVYTRFLIIKHFTSVKNELSKKNYAVHFDTFEKMYRQGILELLITDMFDEIEVQKVIDKMHRLGVVSQEYANQIETLKRTIESNVENDVLKNKLLEQLN